MLTKNLRVNAKNPQIYEFSKVTAKSSSLFIPKNKLKFHFFLKLSIRNRLLATNLPDLMLKT